MLEETTYIADEIGRMVVLLIDNIFVKVGGCLLLQVIRISLRKKCAALLTDLFLYFYEVNF